jgi:hypothetical protein
MENSFIKIVVLAIGVMFALILFSSCSEEKAASPKENPAWVNKTNLVNENKLEAKQIILSSRGGVAAVFNRSETGCKWTQYKDLSAKRSWNIGGDQLTIAMQDGKIAAVGQTGFEHLSTGEGEAGQQVILLTKLAEVGIEVKRIFSFADDGRTLRMKTWIRSTGEPVAIRRVGLMEISVEGENLHLMGNKLESFPVFGDHIWAGVEHYSAFCETNGTSMSIYRYFYEKLGNEWTEVPSSVFGSASEEDLYKWEKKGVRRAFLHYLDTIRIKLHDIEVHTNNWWTAPCPFDEKFVLKNYADLKKGLYDTTGFFFDSAALDLGWSDPHSIWEVDTKRFPNKLHKISDTLSKLDCKLGIWVSPGSSYPPGLDNKWLKESGYDVIPNDNNAIANVTACFAIGNKYQREFRDNVCKLARDYNLGHIKFDYLTQTCDVKEHGHPIGEESFRFMVDGMADVIDALRKIRPDIVTEPIAVCGYPPSPWWLTKIQITAASHGDDVPQGQSPCPEWIQSLITARDVHYTGGREKWIMPSDALESFDIVIQYDHDIEDLCVIDIGRGRWFIATYINPEFMNKKKWAFFTDLMKWARYNRENLRNAEIIGGRPVKREPYGYAFYDNPKRQLYCVRNPWIESALITLPELPGKKPMREVRTLYPRREVLARVAPDGQIPAIELAPYEMLFIEVVPTEDITPMNAQIQRLKTEVSCALTADPKIEKLLFGNTTADVNTAFQTVEAPELKEALGLSVGGKVDIQKVKNAELCVLVEGQPNVAYSRCVITVDGKCINPRISATKGAFEAASIPQVEHWKWFIVPVESGKHSVTIEAVTPLEKASFGVYLRGRTDAQSLAASFGSGPEFPLYNPDSRAWSKTVLPLTEYNRNSAPQRFVSRTVTSIDGVYLDSLKWTEATSGNAPVQCKKSNAGNPIYLSGQEFYRGFGTYAYSRIAFDVPEGFSKFAATIGCGLEGYYSGKAVFVVEGDGKELYRSPLLRLAHGGIDIELPIKGVKKLVLIVDEGDYAIWAGARLLR